MRDQAALDFCIANPKCRIVIVYPQAVGHNDDIKKILENYGTIVYEKRISLKNLAAYHFIKHVYFNNYYFGINANLRDRIQGKTRSCFPQDSRKNNPIRVYLLEQYNPSYLHFRQSKMAIRKIFSSQHAIHSDHNHSAAIRFAQAVFCTNTIHFFNNRSQHYLPNIECLLDHFEQWLKKLNINQNDCCIVGESINAIYGQKDSNRIDFIYSGPAEKVKAHPVDNIYNENDNDAYFIFNVHKDNAARIIYNPKYHFYYRGFKFALPSLK
jgi:hypothetical protein